MASLDEWIGLNLEVESLWMNLVDWILTSSAHLVYEESEIKIGWSVGLRRKTSQLVIDPTSFQSGFKQFSIPSS